MKLRLTNCITIVCCALLGCTGPSPRRRVRNNAAARDSNAHEGPSAPSSAQELAGRKGSPNGSNAREELHAPSSAQELAGRKGSPNDSNAREELHAPSSAQELAGKKGPPGDSEGRNESVGAVSAKPTRAAEPVTFRNKSLSLTIAPDGAVSLKREDTGEVVSDPKSRGWSIYNWTKAAHKKDGPRYPLNNMAEIGPNRLLLWSSDGKYEVKVAIIPGDRYFKFELLHVSNNPEGDLDDDWPGHRVEFDIVIGSQPDGWKLDTFRLNPMSELARRQNYCITNGSSFSWPYPQWAQTEDRPQPQGMVGVFGFTSDEEHDDILADIWVAEPSLPRPNRANLKSWTRKDVDDWLDRCEKFYGTPLRTLRFSPIRMTESGRGWEFAPDTLFPAADLAAEGGMNSIYMSQHHWQDHNIGKLNPDVFPGGREQGIAWREHCDRLGIRLLFHGFSHLIRKPDPDYGWKVVHEDLARSARGTLLQDVPAEAQGLTILVEPDWDYRIGMKKGMLPFYDINKLPIPQDYNGGRGGTFPPYYEVMASLISLNKNLYRYTAEVTPDNKWKIKLAEGQWARQSQTPLVEHKRGDIVEFVLTNANGNYFLPDSRSDLLVQQAIGYAKLLNDMQTSAGYDGSAWTEDLGSWGLRRFSQEVYERLDHPGGGGSALGIVVFGHFEANFIRIQKANPDRGGSVSVFPATASMLAPSFDYISRGASGGISSIAQGKKIHGIGIGAIHSGVDFDAIKRYGLWKDAGALIAMWSALKPHLRREQAEKMVVGMKDGGFYVASETERHWLLTKKRAMRRDGIDGTWNVQPERPPIEPRQFLKANGGALTGLKNPWATQKPEIDIHVMANMSNRNPENVSLMPTVADEIINPKKAEQTLSFEGGNLVVAHDNSRSSKPYEYYARNATVGHWNRPIDMTDSRGVAITLEGDGSGSSLVFSTDGFPRMYVVDVDFVGERTVEIPTGEVCNNREGWNIFKSGSISQFNYDRVTSFRLFMHKVPAGKKANIRILDVKAMKENHTAGLVDPVITLNGGSVTVKGTTPYNHYLVYKGGSIAKVYDPNWNFVKELPVSSSGFEAVQGDNTFSVTSAKSPDTWLSSRIKVKDTANTITIQKPRAAQR